MDTFTQAFLGAACAQSFADKETVRPALVCGLLSGALADADILFQSPSDPLFGLLMHRHFTHALVFAPLGALIAALLLWPWPGLRRRLGFKRIYLFCLAGYASHGILDVCTSYGTHWLWPFSGARMAWDNVSIIDPVFTLVLVAAILAARFARQPWFARAGTAFCVAYLALGAWAHHRAVDHVRQLARDRGHTVERIRVMPTLGNLILWRSIYAHDGRIQTDAVRLGALGPSRTYPGQSVEWFDPGRELPELPVDSTLMQDIRRFAFFAEGWLARHPDHPQVIGDVRYSMVPNSPRPLWGIAVDPARARDHVAMFSNNAVQGRDLSQFWDMLRGRAP